MSVADSNTSKKLLASQEVEIEMSLSGVPCAIREDLRVELRNLVNWPKTKHSQHDPEAGSCEGGGSVV